MLCRMFFSNNGPHLNTRARTDNEKLRDFPRFRSIAAGLTAGTQCAMN